MTRSPGPVRRSPTGAELRSRSLHSSRHFSLCSGVRCYVTPSLRTVSPHTGSEVGLAVRPRRGRRVTRSRSRPCAMTPPPPPPGSTTSSRSPAVDVAVSWSSPRSPSCPGWPSRRSSSTGATRWPTRRGMRSATCASSRTRTAPIRRRRATRTTWPPGARATTTGARTHRRTPTTAPWCDRTRRRGVGDASAVAVAVTRAVVSDAGPDLDLPGVEPDRRASLEHVTVRRIDLLAVDSPSRPCPSSSSSARTTTTSTRSCGAWRSAHPRRRRGPPRRRPWWLPGDTALTPEPPATTPVDPNPERRPGPPTRSAGPGTRT